MLLIKKTQQERNSPSHEHIDQFPNFFTIVGKCGRNMLVLKHLQSVKQRYMEKEKLVREILERKIKLNQVFILSAPSHECKDDKDCDSRAKCEEDKCICQGNTTGNGKYCRGN